MAKKKEAVDAAESKQSAGYTKEQLMKAKAFSGRQDILTALIADGEALTVEQAQDRIDKFLKGQVK